MARKNGNKRFTTENGKLNKYGKRKGVKQKDNQGDPNDKYKDKKWK